MPIEFGIILGAPTTWSTLIMTNKLHSCVDPYLDSFTQSFAAANYARATLSGYLQIIGKLGRIMDAEGVEPSALTPDLADRLGSDGAVQEVWDGAPLRFLDYRFGEATPDVGSLRPADAIGFMEHVLTSARRDKTVATHIRIFLQYLFGCGATATNLALSVPKAAKVWGARLPRHLSPEGVEAVLACVLDNPRHGARDYAMLLLMARLGLRAAEVIAIQLG
jgi:hypothetical protein